MKRTLLIIFGVILGLCLGPSRTSAQSPPSPLEQSQSHLYNMEYDEALHLLRAYLKEHPDDPRGLNYLATVLLHREMNRWGILEKLLFGQTQAVTKGRKPQITESFQKEFLDVIASAQQVSRDRLARNPDDREAQYWLGVSRSTFGTYRYALKKSYMGALGEAKASRKLHEKLIKQDPTFIDAKLVPGAHEYIAGSLPWFIRMMASLAGYSGSKKQGLRMVEEVSRNGELAREDAQFMLVLFYGRERRNRERGALLQELAKSHPRNYLVLLGLANTSEILGDSEGALEAYETLLDLREKGNSSSRPLPISRTSYQAGLLRAKLGRSEEALSDFEVASNGGSATDPYALLAGLAAAEIYAGQNQVKEAIEKYERVRAASPTSKAGKRARKALRKLRARRGRQASRR